VVGSGNGHNRWYRQISPSTGFAFPETNFIRFFRLPAGGLHRGPGYAWDKAGSRTGRIESWTTADSGLMPPQRHHPPDPAAEPTSVVRLPVRAVPNAPRSALAGWVGDAVKVKLKAPPVEGKANAELCRFLSETLGVGRAAVTLAAGETSRHKWVLIRGLSLAEIRARLTG
jgi:uncharacterized protein